MSDDDEKSIRLYKLVMIENSVTIAGTVALVLGLYAMGAGGWSMWGLLLLLNITTINSKTKDNSQHPVREFNS